MGPEALASPEKPARIGLPPYDVWQIAQSPSAKNLLAPRKRLRQQSPRLRSGTAAI
jgi:hypothetical protein